MYTKYWMNLLGYAGSKDRVQESSNGWKHKQVYPHVSSYHGGFVSEVVFALWLFSLWLSALWLLAL